MKTRMVEVREGEMLGPIDWSFDFRPSFDSYCMSKENQDKLCLERIAMFHRIEDAFKAGKKVLVYTHSDFGKQVLDMGMYDGWPYWKPVPSVFYASPLGGGEWSSLSSVSNYSIPNPAAKR